MAFGSWDVPRLRKKKGIKSKLWGIFIWLFGIPDLHGAIRLRVLGRFFQPMGNNIGVGAGWGHMSVEFFLATAKSIAGLTYTDEEYGACREIVDCAGLAQYVLCGQGDALRLERVGLSSSSRCIVAR